TFDPNLDGQGFPITVNFGNAFVKLSVQGRVPTVIDYWTMHDTVAESDADEDLGSGGIMLLPDLVDQNGMVRHLGVGAGKDANVYVFDRDNMGKFTPNDDGTLYQELAGGLGNGEWAAPAWFNGTIYFGAVADTIQAFPVSAATLSTAPPAMTTTTFGYPGTTPAISANGTDDAILWALEYTDPVVLHAYDATDVTNELYNSSQAPNNRDNA